MQEVREKKVFQYDRNKDPDTWWTSFKNFLWENFFRSFSNEGEPAFKWLYYILKYGIIGGAVLLLIRFLYKNSGFSPFRKTAEGAEFDNLSIAEENIQKRDLDEEIREALDKKDHKKAVRTHFLKVLQRLDDMGSIQYSPEKTNSEHMEELRGSPFESGFRTISDIYEAIWYGDFRIDERDYEEVALQFNEFEALIDQDVQRVQ